MPIHHASCEIWEIPVDEPSITVTVTSPVLPMTGIAVHQTLIVALTLLAVGSALLVRRGGLRCWLRALDIRHVPIG
ncbi:hypothetical protein BH23ACT4_BH23ACT4_10700 [soil metagenome]